MTRLPPARTSPRRKLVAPGRVGPRRPVPASIPRPDYARSGRPKTVHAPTFIRDPERLARLRRACQAAAQTLEKLGKLVRPGITTDELDAVAHEEAISRGAYPSPLGYYGFPKSLCTSVNEVICHGIPDSRALEDGDIVNLDVTLFLDGMHGDCSATFLVGAVDASARRLVEVTRECMDQGIGAVRPGRPVSDIGRAIEVHAGKFGFGVVRYYCGHGIGEQFQSPPQVPHYFDPEADMLMEPGMVFTVEPMITLSGCEEDEVWADGWTAVTADRSLTAQFEQTVIVTQAGVEILTVP